MQTAGLAILTLIALDIWAGISIIQSDRTPRVKALWLAIIVLLPLIGFMAWIVAGPRSVRH